MKINILAPAPGESVSTVTLAKWIKSNGSFVEKNEDIAEIESEKASLTVTATESGVLEIIANEGDTVDVQSVIAFINSEGVASNTESENKKIIDVSTNTTPKSNIKNHTVSGIKATPLAKAMIEEHQITADVLSSIQHKITRSDVLDVLQNKTQLNPYKRGEIVKPMTSLRKKLSERLVSVKNETAMLTTFNEVDMSAIIALRKKEGETFQKKYGIKLGFMSFFAHAVSQSLIEYPAVNSQINEDNLITFPYVDISIAVQTEKGLVVPVVKNTHDLAIPELELEIYKMAEKARNKKLTLDEMQGGTFTITNGGVFGSLLSTPIINPPQAAILGMHNIVERPIALNGEVVIRPMMYIALSYDHRIIDGKDSVLFLKKVKEILENPILTI